jgi:hypothetical protein
MAMDSKRFVGIRDWMKYDNARLAAALSVDMQDVEGYCSGSKEVSFHGGLKLFQRKFEVTPMIEVMEPVSPSSVASKKIYQKVFFVLT